MISLCPESEKVSKRYIHARAQQLCPLHTVQGPTIEMKKLTLKRDLLTLIRSAKRIPRRHAYSIQSRQIFIEIPFKVTLNSASSLHNIGRELWAHKGLFWAVLISHLLLATVFSPSWFLVIKAQTSYHFYCPTEKGNKLPFFCLMTPLLFLQRFPISLLSTNLLIQTIQVSCRLRIGLLLHKGEREKKSVLTFWIQLMP